MTIIRVFTKQVYGRDAMYVVGPAREHVARLTGKVTVDKKDIEALMRLGHKIVVYDSETMATAAERGTV